MSNFSIIKKAGTGREQGPAYSDRHTSILHHTLEKAALEKVRGLVLLQLAIPETANLYLP